MHIAPRSTKTRRVRTLPMALKASLRVGTDQQTCAKGYRKPGST